MTMLRPKQRLVLLLLFINNKQVEIGVDEPSKRSISGVLYPTAVARDIRCASPPLRWAQVLSQSSGSIPHAFDTSTGSSELDWVGLSRFLEPKEATASRKSRGVPGRRDGR